MTETKKVKKPRKTKSQPPAEQPASSVPEVVIEKPKRGRKPKVQEQTIPSELTNTEEIIKPSKGRKQKQTPVEQVKEENLEEANEPKAPNV